MNNKIKFLIKDTLYNSLAQAIIKIMHTPFIVLKLVLIFFVFSTITLASYLIIEAILSYFSYEVTTMTRSIFETPAPFPKITICNSNPFTTEYALEFLKNANKIVSKKRNLFDSSANYDYSTKAKLATEIYSLALFKMNAYTFSDINKTALGHSLDDILISCKFNAKACTRKDFTWKFDKTFGNCFIFNSNNQTESLSIAGSETGLQLVIYSGYHEDLRYINSVMGDSGLKIKIENNTFIKDDPTSAIQISAGFKTDIIIERIFTNTLPKPYSNCDISSQQQVNSYLFNLINKSPYIYDQQLCLKQCRQKFYIDTCNCTSSRTLSLFNLSYCESNEQLKCKDNDSIYIINSSFLDKCLLQCPLECSWSKFKIFTSLSQLIGDSFVDYIRENRVLASNFVAKKLKVDTARESIFKVNIFYDQLMYTISYELPKMNFISLIAYTGGILGLFLGISVFSICECIEVLIEMYFLLKKISAC